MVNSPMFIKILSHVVDIVSTSRTKKQILKRIKELDEREERRIKCIAIAK